jgi:hypothetical protein
MIENHENNQFVFVKCILKSAFVKMIQFEIILVAGAFFKFVGGHHASADWLAHEGFCDENVWDDIISR